MHVSSTFVRRTAVLGTGILLAVGVVTTTADAGTNGAQKSSVIYSSTPTPLKGNMVSVGFQATQTNEIGDDVTFRNGGRRLTSVTVTMSSWGCQSGSWVTGDCVTTSGATFSVPMTLTLYSLNGIDKSVGPAFYSTTQTFAVPYRPSASAKCGDGRWFDSSLKQCFNGFATNVTFSLPNVAVDDSLVWGVAFNTTSYGAEPIGTDAPCFGTSAGCGYDSLNVGTSDVEPSFGSTSLSDIYYNTETAGNYCDKGLAGVGAFRLDAGCWGGYVPAVQFKAAS